ncbi:hypothetical protein AVEN_32602-1 [Araneus ventricosus]|uniref:Uncharacterized protein n=1 Tax=Araneus ventricosus TaxID=182803 RepID=A0A4Y2C916_ARAVE|nr:hypothetical protein AVEN_32602-1 [Araneus ventricosus]
MENDDKEDDDDDTDPSQSLLTSQEPLQSVQSQRAFFSSLSSTNDDHFRELDSMQILKVDEKATFSAAGLHISDITVEMDIGWINVKPATHFTDKLYILEREKEKAIKIYGNEPNGLPWLEFRLD